MLHPQPSYVSSPLDHTQAFPEGDGLSLPQYFHATTLWQAQREARTFLREAAACARCCHGLAQMHERLGSTFFHDDDPRVLLRCFEPEDRNPCVLQILAAYIAVHGRKRKHAMH